MTMRPRQKLSDVEAGRHYLFRGPPTTFEKSFPMVASLRVEIRAERIWGAAEHPTLYTERTVPPLINCGNPRCYGGGLNLERVLRWDVVERRKTEYEAQLSCEGYEGSPKGRRRTGSCDTTYRLAVAVTYKDSTPADG